MVAEARATTNRVARTFSLACRLLPKDVREDVYLLYLVFRTLDDLVDESRPDAEERVAAVEAWARGEDPPRTREVAVLADLARRHPLPRDAFTDFCEGMRWDLERREFATEAELDAYCYRVAGTVGVVMAAVLGTTDDERARPAAAALGMAMQRTNILRDLDEDGAAGRSYLAREVTDRFGAPVPGGREALLRDQIAKADARYEEGLAGVALPAPGRGGRPRGRLDVPGDPAPDRARRLRSASRPRRRAAAAQGVGGRARDAAPARRAVRSDGAAPAG